MTKTSTDHEAEARSLSGSISEATRQMVFG